jgi:hypothetical protein
VIDVNGTVIGKPPAPEDKADFAASANLAPDKSLQRVQELAKFVFSSVAVVGTLLTGLGLFTDLGDVLENSAILPLPWGEVPVAVAALGLSLFFASVALWPKMSSVDLSRPKEVNGWYRRQIRRRGVAMIASLFLFSGAILVATFTGTSSIDDPENPAISASWTGIGDDATVKVSVEMEKVPDDWTMVTTVRGRGAAGKGAVIFRDRTRPASDGALKVAGEIGVGKRFGRIESTARLYPNKDAAGEPSAESGLSIKR